MFSFSRKNGVKQTEIRGASKAKCLVCLTRYCSKEIAVMGKCSRCVVKMRKRSAGIFFCPQCGALTKPYTPPEPPKGSAPLPVPDFEVIPDRKLRGVIRADATRTKGEFA